MSPKYARQHYEYATGTCTCNLPHIHIQASHAYIYNTFICILGIYFPSDRFMAVHQLPNPCLAAATTPPNNNNNNRLSLKPPSNHLTIAPTRRAVSHASSLLRTSVVSGVMQMRENAKSKRGLLLLPLLHFRRH